MLQLTIMNKLTVPNLLSGARLLMAPFAFYFIVQTDWTVAAIILIASIGTDLLDGFLARRWNQTSAFGGLIDHGSDAILVTTMLSAEVILDLVPAILPVLMPDMPTLKNYKRLTNKISQLLFPHNDKRSAMKHDHLIKSNFTMIRTTIVIFARKDII